MYTLRGKYTDALLTIDNLESECISQVYLAANHPAFTNRIAIMPDAHAGKGSVVGFTAKVANKVIPNTVGVDIGCGMYGVQLKAGFEITPRLETIDKRIRAAVPMGFEIRNQSVISKKTLSYEQTFQPQTLQQQAHQLGIQSVPSFDERYFGQRILKINKQKAKQARTRVYNSLGTLGGGNHFIEIGRDTHDYLWIIIHSGSRQFGLQVCNYHQDKARKLLKTLREDTFEKRFKERRRSIDQSQWEELRQQLREELQLVDKIPKGMEYLEGENLDKYLLDMILAQRYAAVNRTIIAAEVMIAIGASRSDYRTSIQCVHNYIDPQRRMIRKGACSAEKDELLLVPFNMRDGTLVCIGKGNPDWNYSAPHGAGRIMSRSEAKKQLQLEDFQEEMKDVYSTSVCSSTLDEAPGAYKNPQLIEEAIAPTATVIDRIKPILNIKAR